MELEGTTILVTRASGQNETLRRQLEALGARVIEIPTIEIQPPDSWQRVDELIPQLSSYNWVVFTSANGVSAFESRARGHTLPKVAVVGGQTARRAEALGIPVALIPRDYRSEGLLEAFPAVMTDVRVLLPRGDLAGEELPDALRARGASVDTVIVYRTRVPPEGGAELRHHLETGHLDCVTFTSGSTVRNLLSMLDVVDPQSRLARTAIAVIGPATAQVARQNGLRVEIEPAEATIPALVGAIRDRFGGNR